MQPPMPEQNQIAQLPPGAISPNIIAPDDSTDPSLDRKALVKEWTDRVKSGKAFFKNDFKQMDDDMKFASGEQWDGGNGGRYVANIVQRHLNQRVASLYAKDPRIVAKRRRTMDFTLWDESMETVNGLLTSLQGAAQVGQQADPNSLQLINDIMQGMNKHKLMDKIAKTMEILAEYTLSEQQPGFKVRMKQLVRRTSTVGVGYVKVDFARALQKRPDDVEKVTDITSQIAVLEREAYNLQGPEKDQNDSELAALKVQLAALNQNQEMVVNEGVVFDFPKSKNIIVDPRCSELIGFVGAKWIAQEFILSVNDVKEVYHVDLKKGQYTNYTAADEKIRSEMLPERGLDGKFKTTPGRVRVWEIYSKDDKMLYVVAEGYCDFLREPGEPNVKLKRFWPIFPLAFNVREDDDKIYPQSDVFLIRDMQKEYNRQRQGLKEHRVANRPKTLVGAGQLDEEDIVGLRNHPANAVIVLRALQPGQKAEDVLQAYKGSPIDSALYDTSQAFDDIQRVAGAQEADLGGTNGDSATESKISESNRMTSIASNIDDLEDMLNDLAGSMGEIFFKEISSETAKKIAGPGAAWPELTAQEISDQLILKIEAGSSGRPNKAAELDNITKLAPLIMQIPGISPKWLFEQLVMRMDDRLDPTDALQSGLQSIVSMNAQKQIAQGDSQNNPQQQGNKGANNAPMPPTTTPPVGGGQPMLPQPQH